MRDYKESVKSIWYSCWFKVKNVFFKVNFIRNSIFGNTCLSKYGCHGNVTCNEQNRHIKRSLLNFRKGHN